MIDIQYSILNLSTMHVPHTKLMLLLCMVPSVPPVTLHGIPCTDKARCNHPAHISLEWDNIAIMPCNMNDKANIILL